MDPPKTSSASKLGGGPGGSPFGTVHCSSACPAATAASSKTPPGTVAPCVIERTRSSRLLAARLMPAPCRRLREHPIHVETPHDAAKYVMVPGGFTRWEGRVPTSHAVGQTVSGVRVRRPHHGGVLHRARAARPGRRTGPALRDDARARADDDLSGQARGEPQNSVGATGGGSTPPLATSLASSRRPRRSMALRGAKSSRLLLKSA